MLFSSFAHRLLLTFGLVVLAALAVFAAKVGLLGAHAQAWVAWILSNLYQFYGENQGDLDFAAKAIGAVGTAVGAAWTVHKGWHYAERNLPARLDELNARWKDAVIRSRIDVVPALSQIVSIAPPIAVRPRLLWRLFSWLVDTDQEELLRCSQKLDKHEAELRVLTSSRDRCRAEVMTGYLELGARLARCAPDNGQGALNVFKKPLEFYSKDIDALDLSARQAFSLGFDQPAFKYLSKLAVAAAEANEQIRHFRALRFQAEILHGRDNQASWANARAKLAGIIASLTGADGLEPGARNCELALAHELLAHVQITREKFTAARTELNAARELFQVAPKPCGPEGLKRLDTLSKRLDEAERDKDNPDVAD